MRAFLMLAAGIALFAFQPAAADPNEEAPSCALRAEIAGAIMGARQDKRPKAEVAAKAEAHFEGRALTLVNRLITRAYAQPRFRSARYRELAVSEFSERVRTGCLVRIIAEQGREGLG